MSNWSRFYSMASVLCILILVFSVLSPDCLAAAADTAGSGGGYLSGYENTDPKPSQMSWWSTLAYLVSLVAVFAFVVVMAYFASKFHWSFPESHNIYRRTIIGAFGSRAKQICLCGRNC